MKPYEIKEIADQISYKPGWGLIFGYDGTTESGRYYLQVENTLGVCAVTGKPDPWKGRKQHLSPWMTRQEIVGICFSLIKDAEEHEMREWFRYKGRSIYNPHLDPDLLVEVASKASSFNTRPDSMTEV